MTPRGIIVLEGADASGKSTLARYLKEHHGARIIHNRRWPRMWAYHTAAIRLAIKWADRGLVVLDRGWLSELVYGSIFRGAPAFDLGARSMDRVLQRAGAITVLCAPRDPAHQEWTHAQRFARGEEAFNQIRIVICRYLDLLGGNVAHPGDGYLDQLIRYGDFGDRDDVVSYDWSTQGYDLDKFARTLLARLSSYRSAQYPLALTSRYPNVAGHAGTARVLFVGEAVSPRAGATAWPFYWDDSASATTYLNRALHRFGFDETTAVWTNAEAPDRHLQMLLDPPHRLRVVALGRVADRAVRAAGHAPDVILNHPQWWRRFRHAEIDAYADELQAAVRGT